MKYQEIKELPVKELAKKKSDLAQQLFEAEMKNSLGQMANPLEIRAIRRNIARLNTALVQKVVR